MNKVKQTNTENISDNRIGAVIKLNNNKYLKHVRENVEQIRYEYLYKGKRVIFYYN